MQNNLILPCMKRLDNAFVKLPAIHTMGADELVHYVRFDLALAHAEINGAYALIEIMVLMDFSGSISEVSELMTHLAGARDRLLLLKGAADQRMAHLETEAAKSSRPAILPAHLKLLH